MLFRSKTIKTLWFGRDLTAVGSAWIRGGASPTLAVLKLITDGAFNIDLNGSAVTITGVDLSDYTTTAETGTLINVVTAHTADTLIHVSAEQVVRYQKGLYAYFVRFVLYIDLLFNRGLFDPGWNGRFSIPIYA